MSIYCYAFYTHVYEERLGVQQVGELVERLRHCGLSGLRDVQLPCDHHIVGTVFGGQEEHPVCVSLVVQEGDPSLTHVIRVVLHLNHQV